MSIVTIGPKRKLPEAPEEAPVGEAPVKSKKDEAFELFSQGKTPDDPEVAALGLKPESAKKYFRLWKQR